MTARLIAEKTVKARRAHSCESCYDVAVQAGETYTRCTYVDDERVYDWIDCADCRDMFWIVYEWAGDPDEGVGPDSCQEWADEFRDDPTHGEMARAFHARRANYFASVATRAATARETPSTGEGLALEQEESA